MEDSPACYVNRQVICILNYYNSVYVQIYYKPHTINITRVVIEAYTFFNIVIGKYVETMQVTPHYCWVNTFKLSLCCINSLKFAL